MVREPRDDVQVETPETVNRREPTPRITADWAPNRPKLPAIVVRKQYTGWDPPARQAPATRDLGATNGQTDAPPAASAAEVQTLRDQVAELTAQMAALREQQQAPAGDGDDTTPDDDQEPAANGKKKGTTSNRPPQP